MSFHLVFCEESPTNNFIYSGAFHCENAVITISFQHTITNANHTLSQRYVAVSKNTLSQLHKSLFAVTTPKPPPTETTIKSENRNKGI